MLYYNPKSPYTEHVIIISYSENLYLLILRKVHFRKNIHFALIRSDGNGSRRIGGERGEIVLRVHAIASGPENGEEGSTGGA